MIEVEWDDDVYLSCYKEINDSTADVKLYWGGRDSGKSYNIALKLVEKCLTAPKFKCILIRKTFESIRESQWELIRSIVNELGLQSLFTFTKAPLEIRCINGNGFIARGCDNPHNIKSVTNPTDAWYEEADKLSYSDYSVVSTSLRSNDVDVQEWISFNPESDGDYEEHWLYQLVGERYKQTYSWVNTIKIDGKPVTVNYISCHTDYDDNEYCPPERKAKNVSTTEGDDYLYHVYIKGYWGNKKIERPFAFAYDESKHVAETSFNPLTQTIVVVDFNIDPFCANVYNIWKKDGISHCHQVDEIEVKGGTINELSNRVKSIVGSSISSLYLSGDAMGNNRTIGNIDNKSLFQRLIEELKINSRQLRIVPNPGHSTSREDVNYFLQHYPDFKIGEHCTGTRRDMRVVQIDLYGSIIKRNRKDEAQRADFIDNVRYLVNTFFKQEIEFHRKNGFWR